MGKSASKSSSSPKAAAPASIGSATVAASAEQPNATEGKGPGQPREPLVLDWDPQAIGNEASWEGEHGLGNDPTTDTQTSKRGKKESREVGAATVEDSDGDIDWEQARHDRRFPTEDTETTDGEGAAAAAPATAEEKQSRADKREAVLKALQRQKSNLGAENAARAARAEAAAAAARAKTAEDRIAKASTGTLEERLAFIGMSRAELADAVILNGGELEAAAKENGASNAQVAQLTADIAALKAKLTGMEQTEQSRAQQQAQAQIAESRAKTAELVKDEPVVLVKSMKAYDRVLDGAWQAWKASGKAGAIADYVPAAAEIIEEQLEQEFPDLAALKKGTKAATKDEEEPAARRGVKRPAVGRSTGPSRVANRRDSLAGVTDGHERDRIIAKEMGWT